MVCLILLAIQLVRVSFLQDTKDQKPSLAETLISDEKDVICEGTLQSYFSSFLYTFPSASVKIQMITCLETDIIYKWRTIYAEY